MRNIVLFAGSSHSSLADKIIQRLNIDAGKVELGFFSNRETKVEIKQNVRNKDVFVIQTASGNINDSLMELLILIHACKIASAKRIIAVIPCFPYGRQSDVPFKLNRDNYDMWQARPGTLVANMLSGAGVDHVITLDLHDPQFQGFFDVPADNLYSEPLMMRYIYDHWNLDNLVIVSPDSGGAKRATSIAEKLRVDFCLVHMNKKAKEGEKRGIVVGDVEGKEVMIVDDVVDTGNTILNAAEALADKGASKIYAIITHAILSKDALQRIHNSKIDQIIVSDSLPQDANMKFSDKVKVFSVAPLFAEAIRRIHNGESVSFLFEHVPYS